MLTCIALGQAGDLGGLCTVHHNRMLAQEVWPALKEQRRIENHHGLSPQHTMAKDLRQHLKRDGGVRALLELPVEGPI